MQGRHTDLTGLAVLARMAFRGEDLRPVGTRLLERATRDPTDANALMDLATVLHLTGERDSGLATQRLALELTRVFQLPSATQPAALRLLALMVDGDLTQNNAVEFLVEGLEIDLSIMYVDVGMQGTTDLPEHDVAIVAICESERNRDLLTHLADVVPSWPKPLLCLPGRIARLTRSQLCTLLQPCPGVIIPGTARTDRETLTAIARGHLGVSHVLPDAAFPLIIRPVDSHKGHGLVKLAALPDFEGYLDARPEEGFFLSRYVPYEGSDGLFRKYRVVIIDGRPYACHMAISEHWIVHYMSAGMMESDAKRAEEAAFMADFDIDFGERHRHAFAGIDRLLGLEYVGIDCAETPTGELLIFEIDSGMTVHAMDSTGLLAYKKPQMDKVFAAFGSMVKRRADGAKLAA